MFVLSSLKCRLGLVMIMIYLLVSQSVAQTNKEDRNHYPQSKPIKKNEWKVKKGPAVFSPHLSYREQKQMQMAQKKVSGVTIYVNSKRITTSNYKQPNGTHTKSNKKVVSEVLSDTIAPYKRYDLDTLGL